MDSIDMQVQGLESLKSLLASYSKESVDKALQISIRSTGHRLKWAIKYSVPVSGRKHAANRMKTLQDSIGVVFDNARPRVTVGLTTQYFYKVLDIGRQPYQRKGGKRQGKWYKGTPKFNSKGLRIDRIYAANKDVILKHFQDRLREEISKMRKA